MKYIVNGTIMTRDELVKKVLETVLDLGKEKAPMMAYRPIYSVEHNVKNHACKIAKAMGWNIEVA
jgi:hypothetical protein